MHSREFDSIWLVPMNPLASLFARYCASMDICPDTYRATASEPCWSMMDRNRLAHWVIAVSVAAGSSGSARSVLRYADSARPGAASRSVVVAPLVHSRPKLAGWLEFPTDFVTWRRAPFCSVVTCNTMPQPTPQ